MILPRIKARLFLIIKRAGTDGIATEDIAGMLYEDRTRLGLIRVHVSQMNRVLPPDIRITGQCPRGFYRIIRTA